MAGGKCRFPDLFGRRTERIPAPMPAPLLGLVLVPLGRPPPPVVMGRCEGANGETLVMDGT